MRRTRTPSKLSPSRTSRSLIRATGRPSCSADRRETQVVGSGAGAAAPRQGRPGQPRSAPRPARRRAAAVRSRRLGRRAPARTPLRRSARPEPRLRAWGACGRAGRSSRIGGAEGRTACGAHERGGVAEAGAGVGAGRAASVGTLAGSRGSAPGGAAAGRRIHPTATASASAAAAMPTSATRLAARSRPTAPSPRPGRRARECPCRAPACAARRGSGSWVLPLARQAWALAHGQREECHARAWTEPAVGDQAGLGWKRATAEVRSGSRSPAPPGLSAASRSAAGLAPPGSSGHHTTASCVHRPSSCASGTSIPGSSPMRDERGALVEAQQRGEAGVPPRRVQELEGRRQVERAQLLELGAQRRPRERPSAPARPGRAPPPKRTRPRAAACARARRAGRCATARARESAPARASRRVRAGAVAPGAWARRGAKAKARTASSNGEPGGDQTVAPAPRPPRRSPATSFAAWRTIDAVMRRVLWT